MKTFAFVFCKVTTTKATITTTTTTTTTTITTKYKENEDFTHKIFHQPMITEVQNNTKTTRVSNLRNNKALSKKITINFQKGFSAYLG